LLGKIAWLDLHVGDFYECYLHAGYFLLSHLHAGEFSTKSDQIFPSMNVGVFLVHFFPDMQIGPLKITQHDRLVSENFPSMSSQIWYQQFSPACDVGDFAPHSYRLGRATACGALPPAAR